MRKRCSVCGQYCEWPMPAVWSSGYLEWICVVDGSWEVPGLEFLVATRQ